MRKKRYILPVKSWKQGLNIWVSVMSVFCGMRRQATVQVNQNLSSLRWCWGAHCVLFSEPDREQRQASTQQIRQGPLAKEWDREYTITAGEYNLYFHLPFLITLFQLFCLVFSSVASVLLLDSLAFTSPFFTVFFSCTLSSHHSFVHLQVFSFENAGKENNGTGELTAHFSFWLWYIFPSSPFFSVFLIYWPWGLADPDRDVGAEQHKELQLWTRHALLLAYTNKHVHTCNSPVLTHTYTHFRHSVSVMGQICIALWKLVSMR